MLHKMICILLFAAEALLLSRIIYTILVQGHTFYLAMASMFLLLAFLKTEYDFIRLLQLNRSKKLDL